MNTWRFKIVVAPATAWCLIAATAALMAARPVSAQQQSSEDWMEYVPQNAGLYIEVTGLEGIRQSFLSLGIWHAVRELTEHDSVGASRKPSTTLFGLSPEAAISRVLGRRSALIASSPSAWLKGVVLAELKDHREVKRIVSRGRQSRRAGRVENLNTWVLAGGARVAVKGNMLVLGPPEKEDTDNLWLATVRLLGGSGGSCLRGKTAFEGLRSRVAKRDSGFAYVVWEDSDPYALFGCRNLVVGFSCSDAGLECELHGNLRTPTGPQVALDMAFLRGLPKDTIAIWMGPFGSDSFTDTGQSPLGDESSLIGLFFGMFKGLDRESGDVLGELGPTAAVVLGRDPSARSGDVHLPSLTLLSRTPDAARLADRLHLVVGFFSNLMGSMIGVSPKSLQVNRVAHGHTDLHAVAIGPVLERRLKHRFLARLEIAWAASSGRIGVSSSADHLKRVLDKNPAPLEADRRLAPMLPGASGAGDVVEFGLLRGQAIAEVLDSWLAYLLERHPDARRDGWWRNWISDRLHRRSRFGVAMKDDSAERGRAIVVRVSPESPAAGLLKAGDVVIQAAGAPLSLEDAALSVAKRYRGRGDSTRFSLVVLRGKMKKTFNVPVAPAPKELKEIVNPIRLVRRLARLLRQADAVTLTRHGVGRQRLDLELRVRWNRMSRRGGERPLRRGSGREDAP